jgi:hypothetical protein
LANRFYLTFEEGVALSIHSKVLSKHGINCIGSGSKCETDRVVYIHLDDENKPVIGCISSDSSNAECGSVSCGSRD